MFELLVLGALAVAALAVFGILWAAVSFLFWLLVLPFKLLGLLFKGLGFLIALPFVLIGGLIAIVGFGLVFLTPLLPLFLIVLFVVWLARRGSGRPAHGST